MAYVYRFIDCNNNTIYVGKTCRKLSTRMDEHFSNKGHLNSKCYTDTCRIEYMTFETDADSLLVETYLINKYRPLYNKQNKSNHVGQTIKLDIEENWKLYKQIRSVTPPVPMSKGKKLLIDLFASVTIGIIFFYLLIMFL